MKTLIASDLGTEWCREADIGLPVPGIAAWRSHRPDAHLAVVEGPQFLARCSLWWSEVPPMPNERPGAIGHYAAVNPTAATRLLHEAMGALSRAGCTMAIGPLDGNTWRRYRFVTERGPEPTFFLEPDHPEAWPRQFQTAGFRVLADYTSALVLDLTQTDDRLEPVRRRLLARGVAIRTLRADAFEDELARIHAVTLASFESNFLYTPLPLEDFAAQYRSIRELVREDLVLIAECEGLAVGYVFGIPDYLQRARAGMIDTFVLKTVAVRPGRVWAGLGNLLVHDLQQRAHALGFRRAIHALMHASNNSRNLSRRYARTMRRYTLFATRL